MYSRRLTLTILLIAALVITMVSCSSASTFDPIGVSPGDFLSRAIETGNPEVLTVKTVPETVCNCGEASSTITKRVDESYTAESTIKWEVGGSFGVGAQVPLAGVLVDISPALEATYGKEVRISRTQTVGFDLPANPGTHMGYVLEWREVWQPGRINARSSSKGNTEVKYKYLLRIEGSLVEAGGQNLGCMTLCPEAESSFRAAHAPTRIPVFSVTNQLVQPIQVWANGELLGQVGARASKDFVVQMLPASITWYNIRGKTQNGQEIGELLTETWPTVEHGTHLVADPLVNSQWYFFPLVSNEFDTDCSFVINDGSQIAVNQGLTLAAGARKTGLGYYRLFQDSNVTFYCNKTNPSEYTWFGLRSDQSRGSSFAQEVNSTDGTINFVLQP